MVISQSIAKDIVLIKPGVFGHMWNTLIQHLRNDTNDEEKRAIMTIHRVAFSIDPTVIKQENMDSFLNILKKYSQTKEPDYHIVEEICKIVTL